MSPRASMRSALAARLARPVLLLLATFKLGCPGCGTTPDWESPMVFQYPVNPKAQERGGVDD